MTLLTTLLEKTQSKIFLWLFTLFFSCGIIITFYGFFRMAYLYCIMGLFLALCAGYSFGIHAVRKTYGLDELTPKINNILINNPNLTRQDIIRKGIEYYTNTNNENKPE